MPCSVTVLLPLALGLWLGSSVLTSAHLEDKGVSVEIRAQRFVVVDDGGKKRGELGMSPGGQPAFRIWNERKTMVSTLEIDQSGMPRLGFETADGTSLLDLGVLDKRHPVFILSDADGNRRIGMVVGEAGAVDIGLYDTKKRNRCAISLSQSGDPQIVLRDGRGKARVSLMVDDKGTCALDLFDGTGRERIVFQVDAEDHADAAVLGRDGKPTWHAEKP